MYLSPSVRHAKAASACSIHCCCVVVVVVVVVVLMGITAVSLADAGNRGKVVAKVVPKAGRALLHRHGDACLEHEAARVTSGLKYILRSDVCFVDK